MAAQTQEPTLDVPKDVAHLLDAYAAKLSAEFMFPVTRQQAFERFTRAMMKES